MDPFVVFGYSLAYIILLMVVLVVIILVMVIGFMMKRTSFWRTDEIDE